MCSCMRILTGDEREEVRYSEDWRSCWIPAGLDPRALGALRVQHTRMYGRQRAAKVQVGNEYVLEGEGLLTNRAALLVKRGRRKTNRW